MTHRQLWSYLLFLWVKLRTHANDKKIKLVKIRELFRQKNAKYHSISHNWILKVDGNGEINYKKIQNCEVLHHNIDFNHEVEGNGEIIDDFPCYSYPVRYKVEQSNYLKWTNSNYKEKNNKDKTRIGRKEQKYNIILIIPKPRKSVPTLCSNMHIRK